MYKAKLYCGGRVPLSHLQISTFFSECSLTQRVEKQFSSRCNCHHRQQNAELWSNNKNSSFLSHFFFFQFLLLSTALPCTYAHTHASFPWYMEHLPFHIDLIARSQAARAWSLALCLVFSNFPDCLNRFFLQPHSVIHTILSLTRILCFTVPFSNKQYFFFHHLYLFSVTFS